MKKICRVVMLPTEDETNYPIYTHSKGYLIEGKHRVGKPNGTQCHLYITSDDPMQDGDWGISLANGLEKVEKVVNPISDTKKVIASTDLDMMIEIAHGSYQSIPQISRDFVKEYVKNPVDKVMVEYTEVKKDGYAPNIKGAYHYIPDTEVDNMVIISPVEKKMYTREDMIKALKQGIMEFIMILRLFKNWI